MVESLSAACAHPALGPIESDIRALLLGDAPEVDIAGDRENDLRQMRSIAVSVLAVLSLADEVSCCIINRTNSGLYSRNKTLC